MAISKRQAICTAIDTRLKTITIVNGYETNLGNNVYEFWDIALEESELPAVIWKDGNESSTLLVTNMQDRTLTIELVLQTTGVNAPSDLRKMIADIEKAMNIDDTWNNLVINSSVLDIKDVFEIEYQERRIGACRAAFTVTYRTGYLNSYS